MKRVIFRREARADALEAYRWYEEKEPGLGTEFRTELGAAIQRIPTRDLPRTDDVASGGQPVFRLNCSTSGRDEQALGPRSNHEPLIGAGEGGLLLEDVAHEQCGREVDGVSAAQWMATEEVIDAAVHVVVDGDTCQGLEVRAKGLLPLVDHAGVARLLAALACEGGDRLGYRSCEAAASAALLQSSATASEPVSSG